ncbi:hypothetical protein BN7_2774 [Wickerhamomyces ciferrii]|uniref:Uncharacterized protein n=1 Tax=Wickerhamomyces ciferrii (strain ATCC 14091 / BCRC 22168 / CBS 111 / JCM 3599 / NBRC 0793 / NRRL Y-1031 F-60-10) TaxID=1206466 RepID=K0KLZ6_WICCF|nr:uncharacterized protein BN7_2774 [Wickerhamomyces ciferrii]CCH43227.1 hypothetical protein BN7_2774 [Wickerhamomyces ciferrii]
MIKELKFDITAPEGSAVKLFHGKEYYQNGAYIFFEEVQAQKSLYNQSLSMSKLEKKKGLTRIEIPNREEYPSYIKREYEEATSYTIYSNEEDLNGNKSFVKVSYHYSECDWKIEDYKILNESEESESFEDVKPCDTKDKYVSRKFRPVVVMFLSKTLYSNPNNYKKEGTEQSTIIFRPES